MARHEVLDVGRSSLEPVRTLCLFDVSAARQRDRHTGARLMHPDDRFTGQTARAGLLG
jgi:hypothetical protein